MSRYPQPHSELWGPDPEELPGPRSGGSAAPQGQGFLGRLMVILITKRQHILVLQPRPQYQSFKNKDTLCFYLNIKSLEQLNSTDSNFK